MTLRTRYRDERVAGSWARETSVLRIDTMSRHVRSAIGAPIPELVLADQNVDSPSCVWFTRSDAYAVEVVLGPLLVKEGHGMGAELSIGAKTLNPVLNWIKILNLME